MRGRRADDFSLLASELDTHLAPRPFLSSPRSAEPLSVSILSIHGVLRRRRVLHGGRRRARGDHQDQ